MNYEKLLAKLFSELDNYNQPEFDDSNLESLVLSLESICDEFDDNTTPSEWALYHKCDALVYTAERFFEDVYAQEARDQESDERQYESARKFQ